MNRLLWRLMPLTLAALLLASALVYLLFSRLYGDPIDDIARGQSAAQIFLLEHYIDQAPADEWLQRLNKVREVSPQRYELLPLAELGPALDAQARQRLEAGELIIDVPARAFMRRVDIHGQRYVDSEADVLRVSGLPIDVGQVWRRELIRLLVVAAVLLVPLVWWSRAHWRDLMNLSRLVQAWAGGQLQARAPRPLSGSLSSLTEGMNQMAGRLEHLLDGRRHLLHAVSHELRTPIARMGFGLALLRDALDPSEREARLRAMEEDLDELQGLVTELLGYSRLEQAPLQLARVDLETLLQQSLALPLPAHVRLEVELATDLGSMPGDGRQLARVLANLLGNAGKYARQRVLVRAQPVSEHCWRLVVEDDGPGIAPTDRQRVFEPFVRLKRTADEGVAGHGLGLAIVARIVALHQGRIWFEASELGGARCVIEWPRGETGH